MAGDWLQVIENKGEIILTGKRLYASRFLIQVLWGRFGRLAGQAHANPNNGA